MKFIDQKAALIYFIEDLDIEMIDSILDPGKRYMNELKKDFLHNLSSSFNEFVENGDTHLVNKPGRCKFSVNKDESFIFFGTHSNSYIEINIISKDRKIINISECFCFSSSLNNTTGHRIYIDPQRGLPF